MVQEKGQWYRSNLQRDATGHGSELNMKDQTYDTANPEGKLLIYQADDGKKRLDVRLERETLWMTQNDMAPLFQCSVDNISLHLRNIYSEGELTPSATTEEFSVVRQEGARHVSRRLTFCNLDMIISVEAVQVWRPSKRRQK
jgi:hypothetical protein